ncbi:DUF5753 domain-containing protein [Actinoallomurus sp. NPDC052274]|uniref:DUF5753 domain-containing protein n=1 Tax=Actinoallomurus sp. NPDC052274 TaxID=3155420 RepID=UPI003421ACDF
MFGQVPAVLAVDVGQQPAHVSTGSATWLDAAEPAGDPGHQLVEDDHPAVRVYAVARGHRTIFRCPHKLRMITRWPLPCDPNASRSRSVTGVLSHNPDWPARVDRCQRESDQLKIFHNSFIPIPFQTEDYARGLLSAGHAAGLVEDLDTALARRLKHQAAILQRRPVPPLIWAVLDEAALRPMGAPSVMKAQFEHLIECSELSHVSLRIVPLTAAPHVGIDGWFTFFELPGRHLAAFAGATLDVGRMIDEQAEAAAVSVRFDRIAAQALNEDQTRDLLKRAAEDL